MILSRARFLGVRENCSQPTNLATFRHLSVTIFVDRLQSLTPRLVVQIVPRVVSPVMVLLFATPAILVLSTKMRLAHQLAKFVRLVFVSIARRALQRPLPQQQQQQPLPPPLRPRSQPKIPIHRPIWEFSALMNSQPLSVMAVVAVLTVPRLRVASGSAISTAVVATLDGE